MRLDHPEPFGPTWHATWIWFERPAIVATTATRPELSEPRATVGLFRRSVALVTVPDSAPCRVWVDGRYVLEVNGLEVARGPVRSDPRRAHYDVVDLAPFLRPGENVLAVTAHHYGEATSWWTPVPPTYSLGGGSLVLEVRLGTEWLTTDDRWRVAPGHAWTAVPVPGDVACLPVESFDARAHPSGWQWIGFDDSGWRPAIALSAVHTGGRSDPHPPSEPFGMLHPPVRRGFPWGARHTATFVGERIAGRSDDAVDPVRQLLADEATGGTGLVVRDFDLGRIAAGTVLLRVEGAPSGTVIDVAVGEHEAADGTLAPLGQHAGFRYVCAGGDVEEFETSDVIGARHLHAAVRSVGAARVGLDLAVQDRHRPRPDGAWFECSDPLMNEIYAIGLRTVDLCALDAYVDCPTREQRAWTGDSVVHQMVDLVANPDWSMARWHPQLAAEPRPDGMLAMAPASDFAFDDRTIVPDWALHWVRSLHNLYRYTGDRELVSELLPVASRVLRWFESYLGDDGLLHDVSGWVLLDWASVHSAGTCSTLNALWARALEDLAELAAWTGDTGTADWASARRGGVAEGFELFWDERRGVYVDHVLGGVPQRPAAQHPGAAALAAGIVPDGRRARVIERLMDRSRLLRHSWVMDSVTVDGDSSGFVHLVTGYPPPTWNVEDQMVEAEPFFRYVLHDGLARAGRADLVAGACRDWKVFLDAGQTTWPECWTGGTRCHGWSSTPTRDLIVHVLGITPGSPGFGSVQVAPALGGLDWARATVPTPHGFITVEAHADGRLVVDSPVPVTSSPEPHRPTAH